jgi:hypothetical protein
MLGAKPNLVARGFHVSTAVSRQFGDAVPIVRAKVQDGSLRRRLVIHLGTNGVLIDPDDCDAIARLAGRRRHVHLVTIKIPR